MKWKTKQPSLDDVRTLQEKFGLNLVCSRILASRDIDKNLARFYLERDVSFLHNPFLFEDMEIFCDRILDAVEAQEKVRIFGDRDADGITSTALIVSELKSMGLDVSFTLPMGDEPYGVTNDSIDKAINDGVTLAVTVDCGISAFQEIDYAQSKGLDFLVTDHHISPGLPPARAVIDPKIEGCGYPFRDLAGCGVVAKCIWALRLARTPLYDQSIMFLHAYPGNGTVIIEAAILRNLIQEDRIAEEVVPGVLPSENSRLMRFLNCGLAINVFDEETELIQMKNAFPNADICLTDIRSTLEKYLPSIRGKSLFTLNNVSRFARYTDMSSELDTLIGLYGACVRAMYPSLYSDYKQIMDLVTIGTVSDIMPMVDENRIMVSTGLKMLEQSPRDSLRPFLAMQNLIGHKLTTNDISWQVSPFLNASGRLGKPNVALDMLLSQNESNAIKMAQQLDELNKERQKLGENAWTRLQTEAHRSWEQFGSKLVLVRNSKVQRGITGILATRLQKRFKCPAIVITTTDDGRCVGSIRSPHSFNCHEFLSKYSSLFDDFGGHDCAGGFTLSPDKLDEFCINVSMDVDYMDCPVEEEELFFDIELSEKDFCDYALKATELFEPYGEKNDAIHFRVNNVRIQNITVLPMPKNGGSANLRMTLDFGSSKWPAVFWNAGYRVGEDFDEGEIVDVVFRMGRNWFRNQETIQLTVLDIKRS